MTAAPQPVSPDYEQRDLLLIRQIERDGIGLYEPLGRRYLGGKDAGNAIRKLAAKNWLQIHQRALPGGVSYATLTRQGRRQLGKPDRKVKPLGATALSQAIGLCWYCSLEAKLRDQLLPSELASLSLGSSVPINHPHVMEAFDGQPVVLRAYHALSGASAAKRHATSFFEKAENCKTLRPWINSADFGLLVLAPTEQAVAQIEKAFSKQHRFRERRLVIGLGPTADTLASLLRKRRKLLQSETSKES